MAAMSCRATGRFRAAGPLPSRLARCLGGDVGSMGRHPVPIVAVVTRNARDPGLPHKLAEMAHALDRLFARLDPTYFHPHPLTREEAARISSYDGQDIYLWTEHAYGFLRGWDEGHDVPSLGVAVAIDQEGKGHGHRMMLALHEAARERGAKRIRLRVHPDNSRARRLYDSLGYREAGMERGEVLMLLDL